MHDEAQFVALKINPVIAQPKAVQGPPGPFEPAKSFQIGAHHFLRQAPKLAQNVQLQFLGHVRQFRRAGRIKYDLEWTHRFWLCGHGWNTDLVTARREPRLPVGRSSC